MSPAHAAPISIADNRVFVGVTVDQRGPFSFLLDTGSSSTTLSLSLAQRLKLAPLGQGSGSGAGEQKVTFETVHLAALSAGGIALGAMDVPAMDETTLTRVIGFPQFDGVLGAEIFAGRVVTIDASQRRLTIVPAASFTPPQGAIAVPIRLDADQMPSVDAVVNGIPGRFEVDTGDRTSLTLFGPFWRAHGLDTSIGPTVTAMTGYGAGGPIRALVGRPASFTLGGIAVPPPVTRLSLQKAGAFTTTAYAGSIGMGVLKRFAAAFDYAHHTLWLTRAPDFAAPDRYDRAGVWLGLDETGQVTVIAVTAGGPAAQAGVQPADTVVSVSGIAASPATLSTLRETLKQPGPAAATLVIRRAAKQHTLTLALRDLIAPPAPP